MILIMGACCQANKKSRGFTFEGTKILKINQEENLIKSIGNSIAKMKFFYDSDGEIDVSKIDGTIKQLE